MVFQILHVRFGKVSITKSSLRLCAEYKNASAREKYIHKKQTKNQEIYIQS